MHFIRHLNQKRLGLIVPTRAGIRGEFRAIGRDYKDRVKYDSGWFDNLITTQGLENMGGRGEVTYWASGAHIGTGTTPAAITDTSLVSGVQGAVLKNTYSSPSGTEYYGWSAPVPWLAYSNYARFEAGPTGLIQEVGISAKSQPQNSPSGGGYLSARQILPVPFNKQSTDVLDLYYKAYWYFDTTDATGQVTLNGTLYDYIVRLGGLSGSNQGYTWGCAFMNPTLHRTESPQYSDGELSALTASGLTDGQVSSNYTSTGFGNSPGVGQRWNELLSSLQVDATLTSQTIRCIHSHSWVARLCTQIRLGEPGGDAPVPFTDKDIMSVRFRLYYDRYVPGLYASAGSLTVAGDDANLTVA